MIAPAQISWRLVAWILGAAYAFACTGFVLALCAIAHREPPPPPPPPDAIDR